MMLRAGSVEHLEAASLPSALLQPLNCSEIAEAALWHLASRCHAPSQPLASLPSALL
jgi:hypothetical protein